MGRAAAGLTSAGGRSAAPGRPGRPVAVRRRIADAVTTVLLLAAVTAVLTDHGLDPAARPTDARGYALGAAITLSYLGHRRAPLIALGVALTGLLGLALGGYSLPAGYAAAGVLLGVALHRGGRVAAIGYGLAVMALSVALAVRPGAASEARWLVSVVVTTAVWLTGDLLGARRASAAAGGVPAPRAPDTGVPGRHPVAGTGAPPSDTERSARLAIARDLHEVIETALDQTPEPAEPGAVRADLRRLGALLARVQPDPGPEQERAPDPAREAARRGRGLADLPALLAAHQEDGPVVAVRITGTPALPASADLAAYRIVHEGLDNVARHGGPVAALRIVHHESGVDIEITDEGRPGSGRAGAAVPAAGLGRAREWADLFGGTLRAEPLPVRGFLLHATLTASPDGGAGPNDPPG